MNIGIGFIPPAELPDPLMVWLRGWPLPFPEEAVVEAVVPAWNSYLEWSMVFVTVEEFDREDTGRVRIFWLVQI